MNIIQSDHIFNDYYLRRGDVEPVITKEGLVIHNSNNGKNGNKWCKVESNVIVNEDITSILCSWTCRHGGGQFWRHYKNNKRVMWKSLSDEERFLILDQETPRWARKPGKLKRDYIKRGELSFLETDEAGNIYGYKVLIEEGGQYFSPQRGTLWKNSALIADEFPNENNYHGIYAVKSRKSPILEKYLYAFPDSVIVQIAYPSHAQIVEGRTGLRGSEAKITGIL